MLKLTENMIRQIIKPFPSDLSKITQLNVTDRGLSDISLIRRLVGLEIVSLSVNNITSLASFENCKNLRVLYLRQNKIGELTEIKYLMHLPKLEVLSLLQNPCTEDPLYRNTVIKHLKHLVELDDVSVAEEDRIEAELLGENLFAEVNLLLNVNERRLRRSRSRVNQTQKINSKTAISEKKVRFETFEKNISTEDNLIGTEHPSNLRIPQSRHKKLFYEDIVPGLYLVKSVSGLNPSQCSIFEDAGIDLRCNDSRTPLASQESVQPSNLLMAALFLVKNLEHSDLEMLNAELKAMLNTMLSDKSPSFSR